MSSNQKKLESVLPGQSAGEKVIAVLLWVQTSDCECPACEHLRSVGKDMVSRHIPGSK